MRLWEIERSATTGPRWTNLELAIMEGGHSLEDHQPTSAQLENFADGKNPGRKGLSKRMGIPKRATLDRLEQIAKSSTGERRRMAQWQLNMRRGRNRKRNK
jgi:hypothetical protein